MLSCNPLLCQHPMKLSIDVCKAISHFCQLQILKTQSKNLTEANNVGQVFLVLMHLRVSPE